MREAGGGTVAVSLHDHPHDGGRLAIVDTATLRVVRSEGGLDFADAGRVPGSEALLLRGPGSSLVRYDAMTGERTVLWSGPGATSAPR